MLSRLLQATLITVALHLILGIKQLPTSSSAIVVLYPQSPSQNEPLTQLLSRIKLLAY